MKQLALLFTLSSALLFTGCGAGGRSAENKPAETKPPANTTTAKPAESNSSTSSTTSPAGVTGVVACDEYLAAVEKLIDNPKVPQATRDMYKRTLEQNRTAWKQAASTPQGKAGLETSCKAALDAFKPTLEQFNK